MLFFKTLVSSLSLEFFFFFNYNMWLLPRQVKEQKACFLPMVWFAADLPGVFCKQLTHFRPTASVFLGLNRSELSTQSPHKA